MNPSTGKGRKRKALPKSAYDYRRRHGVFPSASVDRQLEGIIRASGNLTPTALHSASTLVKLCRKRHPRAVGVKDKGAKAFAIMGTAGETILRSLVTELTGRTLYAPDDEASPWLLRTRGTCVPHVDLQTPMVFTLVICIATDEPYVMKISSNKVYEPTKTREVTLDTGSFILFPANVSHECVAAESNNRTIINAMTVSI